MRVRLLVLSIALVLATASCGPADWPMFGFDAAHNWASPDPGISKEAVAGSMVLDWTASFTYLDTGASPAVVNGVVYEPVEEQQGSTFSFKLDAFDASGNTNCSGTPKTCSPLWAAPTAAGVLASPAVVNGVGYVGDDRGTLYAFDAAGNTNCAGTPKVCSPLWTATAGIQVRTSPTVANGIVYVVGNNTANHLLYSFDAAGNTNCAGTPKVCSPLWTATVGGMRDQTGNPAVANGAVYVGSGDGNLYAFDAAGNTNCAGSPKVCSPMWTATPGGVSGPAVGNGVVYLGGDKLYAFDAAGNTNCAGTPKTCSPLWSTIAGFAGLPAVANGVVYAGSTPTANNLGAFDASGNTNCSGTPKTCSPLWTDTAASLAGPPAVANGVVYAGSTGSTANNLYAFDASGNTNCSGTPKTCSPLLTATTGANGLVDPPVVANFGNVYVGAGMQGRLLAYGLEKIPPTTSLVVPTDGATVSGTTTLDAAAHDDVSVSRVEVHLTGGGNQDAPISRLTPTQYGWLCFWDTTSVPNGTYTLNSVAFDPAGNVGRSANVNITVQN